jgi:Bul1-like protein/arrestin (S-antigen)-like protein
MDFARRLISKPDIKVTLDSSNSAFSTHDTITGSVTITSKHSTPFSAVEISLTGITKTRVSDPSRGASTHGADTEAVHRFLRLVQPIDYETDLPADRVLKAGTTYSLPFVFVVPAQLLPHACTHGGAENPVREAHLCLPPSFGDRTAETDDLSYSDVKISYHVRARLVRGKGNAQKMVTLVETARKIRIRPAAEEQPPVNVDDFDEKHSEYCLRKTKTLRKGLLKGKLGTLVMEAAQPSSFRLAALGSSEDASTYLRLRLRFDPASPTSSPPRLAGLTTKLRVNTYWATTARNHLARVSRQPWADLTADSLSDTLPLSNLAVGAVEWEAHKPIRSASALSVDSQSSSDSLNEQDVVAPSENYKDGSVFYTANVLVPMTLPTNKALIPSFHSCLVSRTYGLHVALGVEKGASRSLMIKVPVQVSASPSPASEERTRLAAVAVQAAMDTEEAFEPRSTLGTSEGVVELTRRTTTTSTMEMPPGYEWRNVVNYVSHRATFV